LKKTVSESQGRELMAMRNDLLEAWNACQAMMQEKIVNKSEYIHQLKQELLKLQKYKFMYEELCK
jgi:hypothetical protein